MLVLVNLMGIKGGDARLFAQVQVLVDLMGVKGNDERWLTGFLLDNCRYVQDYSVSSSVNWILEERRGVDRPLA